MDSSSERELGDALRGMAERFDARDLIASWNSSAGFDLATGAGHRTASDFTAEALRQAAEALASLLSERDELRKERDSLIAAVGEHVTVRSEYRGRIDALEATLAEIAKGSVPPDQHGHYLAHRAAVRIARRALSPPLIAPLGGATAGAEPKAQHGTNPLSTPPLGGDGT